MISYTKKTKLLISLFGLIPALVMAQVNSPLASTALRGSSQANQIGAKVQQSGASVVQDMRQDKSSIRAAQTTNVISQQLPVAAPQTEGSPGFNSGRVQNIVPTEPAYDAADTRVRPPPPPPLPLW